MIDFNANSENSLENSIEKLSINPIMNTAIEKEFYNHGHYFVKKTFHKPIYCHHCAEMLWGFVGQGFVCEACNFICHEKCQKGVISPCTSTASNFIKNPVLHCWSEASHFKRKFCNICRKRLEDSFGSHCEICDYYVHLECQEFAINNCRETATYGKLESEKHYHQWREGNLPANSKCAVCKKTCWTSECLAGIRCEWCGITVHSYCRIKVLDECNFGCLKDIIIPPYAVSVPKTEANKEIFGIQSKNKGRNCSECSSSGEIKFEIESNVSNSFSKKLKREKEKICNLEETDENNIIKVYLFDGDLSFQKRTFKTINLLKNYTYQQILDISMKTFHLNEDSFKYYLTIPIMEDNGKGFNETILDENDPITNVKELHGGIGVPSILLRYKENNQESSSFKIHSDSIKPGTSGNVVGLTTATTVKDVIRNTLEKFNIEDYPSGKFHLIETTANSETSERIMESHENPLKILNQRRKESLTQYRMLKFYLKEKDNNNEPMISIFVGNLPNALSQIQYEKILSDILKGNNDLRWIRFDAIYYEYGAIVIVYDNPDKAIKSYKILKDSYFDEKQLTVLLLPSIQPNKIPKNVRPLLVFVNVKSGGQQGAELITSFRHLLNPHQVFDLHNGGPLPGLYVFRNIESYRILACGGDGTIGWVLSCLDNVSQDAKCQSPPMAIVPLGTGNDLARVLRWGTGYTGAEEPINLLRDVIEAEEIILDRWTVVFHPDDTKELDEIKRQISNNINQANTNEDSTQIYVMNNYFGIGIDADISLDFHTAREENPNKFNSRLHNKKYYIQIGLRKIMNKGTCKDFNRYVSLEVDGKKVDLPQIEGIIILNILSWGSGANPWGPEKDDQFQKPTHYDGMLEVVGIKGVVHIGQISSGISGAIRLAQGGRVKIRMNSDIPVQVDGEPWLQTPCAITIIKSALKATMLKKSKLKIRRRNTEPSVCMGAGNSRNDNVYQDGDSEPF